MDTIIINSEEVLKKENRKKGKRKVENLRMKGSKIAETDLRNMEMIYK